LKKRLQIRSNPAPFLSNSLRLCDWSRLRLRNPMSRCGRPKSIGLRANSPANRSSGARLGRRYRPARKVRRPAFTGWGGEGTRGCSNESSLHQRRPSRPETARTSRSCGGERFAQRIGRCGQSARGERRSSAASSARADYLLSHDRYNGDTSRVA
jgi:hypothetical protein